MRFRSSHTPAEQHEQTTAPSAADRQIASVEDDILPDAALPRGDSHAPLPIALSKASEAVRTRVLRSLARTHGNHHVQRLLAPPLQRLTLPTPGVGMGHALDAEGDDSRVQLQPHASYWVNNALKAYAEFGDGQVTSITLPPGTEGILELSLQAHFEIDNIPPPLFNMEYDRNILVKWRVRVSPAGVVTPEDPLPVQQTGGKESLQLYLESVEPTKGENYVGVRVTIGSTTSHGRTHTLGFKELVGVETSSGVGARPWTREFRLEFPGPTADPAPRATPSVAAERDIFFGPGSGRFAQNQADELVEWYGALPAEVRQAVRAGRGSIQLDGYASSTGRSAANVDLAEQRIQAVMTRLRAQAGGDRAFQNPPPIAHGEEPARAATGDRQETADWRRVHIRILVQAEPAG